jgi:hypothetical protein
MRCWVCGCQARSPIVARLTVIDGPGFLTKLHGTDMVGETMRFACMFLILTMAGSGEG